MSLYIRRRRRSRLRYPSIFEETLFCVYYPEDKVISSLFVLFNQFPRCSTTGYNREQGYRTPRITEYYQELWSPVETIGTTFVPAPSNLLADFVKRHPLQNSVTDPFWTDPKYYFMALRQIKHPFPSGQIKLDLSTRKSPPR